MITTALHVTNGQRVKMFGTEFLVGAAHYSGPIDGSGTVTLEFVFRAPFTGSNLRPWQGPASTPMEVVG